MSRCEPAQSFWWTTILIALATVFMLQGSRVFVGYLVFVVDQSQRVTLGVTALAVFLAPGLVWLLVRAGGAQRTILGSTAILVSARVVLQFWQEPTARVVLGAIVIVAWGWLAIVALHRLRAGAALGIVLALGLDIAFRIGAGAIDLPWMPGIGAHLVTVVVAGSVVVAALRLGSLESGSTGPVLPLVALGPALVLHHLVTGNLALAQVKTGLGFPAAWLTLALGVILGLTAVVAATGRRAHVSYFLMAVFSGAMTLSLFWTTSTLTALWLIVATASILYLTSLVLLARDTAVHLESVGRTAAAVTGGMVLQVLLLFVYYTFTGWAAMVAAAWVLLALGALISTPLPRPGSGGRRPMTAAAGIVSLALLLACAWQFVVWSEPQTVAATDSELIIMTYNIQSGFSVDNVWSLEETARAIEAENPDVIVLNEVGRGWLVTSGNDELPWLSQRLEMPYVWGPASDDGLWGNVILSRLPISDVSVEKFASTQNLKRSVTGARIDVGDSGLWVFGTHLDNPVGAGEARMEQVTELIAFWNNRSPAVILGDLNAAPEDDVLTAFTDLGFVDLGVQLGPEDFTSEDGRRIDYILATEGIDVIDIWVPETWASDHKPVVATVQIGD
ncbi:MAG: endonuclease/exonuclease/phosphatase family protein [Chloroflexia bacterium]|nr:endonuclease/exonuclease/phosphatase family protein [Chloroflexia bacterium]